MDEQDASEAFIDKNLQAMHDGFCFAAIKYRTDIKFDLKNHNLRLCEIWVVFRKTIQHAIGLACLQNSVFHTPTGASVLGYGSS